MGSIDVGIVRHLLLRFGLAFILVWFGIQQVLNPGEWTGFVPEGLAGHSLLSPAGMILVHGLLLVLAALGIALGVFPRTASLLAAVLLLEIIGVLFMRGGSGGLIVRDVGLLVMAIVLAFDRFFVIRVRFPNVIRKGTQPHRRSLTLPL